MNYLYYDLNLGPNDVVQVTLDKQANVRLLDDLNYQKYRSGRQHKYYGGLAQVSPVNIPAPHSGHWHLIIDLGGYPGTVHASVNIVKRY